MLGRSDRPRRHAVLLVVIVLMASALGLRLTYWQLARGPELRAIAAEQRERRSEITPPRGRILDREGVVLATTAYRDLLAAYPDLVPAERRGAVAHALGRILDYDEARVRQLGALLAQERPYLVVERQLTDEQSLAVQAGLADGTLVGLTLEARAVRFYPNPGGAPGTTLASQLLGFVTEDGRGQYGVEAAYDRILAGRPSVVAALSDGSGGLLSAGGTVVEPGEPGADVRLTLDASLQLQVEQELHAAWVANGAPRVSALVIDPQDGSVLASASVPGYDANGFAALTGNDASLFEDPLVSQVYEPGSVMKFFTAGAALELGVVTRDTEINDTPGIRIGRQVVYNSDHRGMGKIPFEDVIAYSRNVGTTKVAFRLGRDVEQASRRLHAFWRRMGIGERSGIDVGGELPGLVADPAVDDWEPIDLSNRAFGQGVAVTPLQLARGYAALLNGGMLVTPHLVTEAGGAAVSTGAPDRVLRPALSGELRDLMTHVVTTVPWYAEGTLIPGYVVGGKTGTAQIWDGERGRWISNVFNFTFVGFVGRDRPAAVIVVRIHDTRPRVLGQGNLELEITSFELFRRIAQNVVTALDIPPLPAGGQRPEASPDGGR